ncbi:hypothetical protein D3C76_1266110 [compost metagenome]|uniref:hypothetical protein n=1 Tax=Serratia TaxID=613 RepID=UPI0006617065|nr:hypothetical protein [Serratia sp. 506_PEND]
MNTLETLRLSRFDVVFISINQENKTIKCHFITSALNSFDAAFIFGQNNKNKSYVVLSVDAIN